jgi:hypothetical protein
MIGTLTCHEKVLLVLYRTAPTLTRSRIDAELFKDWTHRPCSIDPAALDSLRFRLAVQQIHHEHLAGPLTKFAGFWHGGAR